MKEIIKLSFLALVLCIMSPAWAVSPIQEPAVGQSSEAQVTTTRQTPEKTTTAASTTPATTTKKSTTRVTTRRQYTTAATEEETSSTIASTQSSETTQSTSANNSVLFGKNKMLSIAAWTLIGIGVLFVFIVVLGGKSRRHRRPFQKSTKRYKNRSKHNNYSNRYRSNIKRK